MIKLLVLIFIYNFNVYASIYIYKDSTVGALLKTSATVTINDNIEPLMGNLILPNLLLEGDVSRTSTIKVEVDFTNTGSKGVIIY